MTKTKSPSSTEETMGVAEAQEHGRDPAAVNQRIPGLWDVSLESRHDTKRNNGGKVAQQRTVGGIPWRLSHLVHDGTVENASWRLHKQRIVHSTVSTVLGRVSTT
jgi:hypothetical protein